jgi:dTDP-4-amino-4,6-dideoxygalactose transaminase
MIPFLDLKAAYLELKEEIDAAIQRVLNSGMYVLGSEVELFEDEFSQFTGADYTVATANGLDSISLILRGLSIGEGDEVIVPSFTFVATWLAVSQVGAKIVPVEPNINTANIDVSRIEQAINGRTKAIIPVHLYGQPSDLQPLRELANKYGLYIIEDAAQAHGARYRGERIGTFGDAAAWSFYPGKNLGAMGDGGAITTNNQLLYERLKVLRNYGSRVKYEHEIRGVNSRLDPIQAAVLRVKLKVLDQWNLRREKIANRYSQALKDSSLVLPFVPEWASPSWHLYVIQHPKRDWLIRELVKSNIGCLVHYPIPPHKQKAYEGSGIEGDFHIAEKLASSVLSLPIGPHMLEEQVDKVISLLSKITS